MKLTITHDDLQAGVGAVLGVVPSRSTLPVLANVLLRAENDKLTITGTDLDIAITASRPANIETSGAITVPARMLMDLCRELSDEMIEMSVQNSRVHIKAGRAKFTLNAIPADEYPVLPEMDFSNSFAIRSDVLAALHDRSAYAASTETSRPVLAGAYWEIGDVGMIMVATDGHRLARASMAPKTATADEFRGVIVPPKALAQAVRLFETEENIQVATTENHIYFKGTNALVLSRLIEGPYPHYRQVIPQNGDKIAELDKQEFVQAIRRMSVLASNLTHRIALHFQPGTLRISVETPDLGEAEEQMTVEYQGDPIDIGFNAVYLLEAIKHIETERLRIAMNHPERAAVITPVHGDEEAKIDYTAVIMPLRLH